MYVYIYIYIYVCIYRHLEKLRNELSLYKSGQITEVERSGVSGNNKAVVERTSNSSIQEAEKKLTVAKKKVDKQKQELKYLEELLQPVKVGCENIAEKLLGDDFNKGEIDDVSVLLEKSRIRLEEYMEFCSQVKPDKAALAKKEAQNSRAVRLGIIIIIILFSFHHFYIICNSDSSLDICTKAFIAASNADRELDPNTPKFIVSPYNIRIKSDSGSFLNHLFNFCFPSFIITIVVS